MQDTSAPQGRSNLLFAVYRGSWQRPDVKFAEAVAATIAKGDAPNFDMPRDANIELFDIGSETLPPSNDFPLTAGSALEERERGWSSTLFPSNPQQSRNQSSNPSNDHPAAEQSPSSHLSSAQQSSAKVPIERLFVTTSSGRGPQ